MTRNDLHPGSRVENSYGAQGTVILIDANAVTVEFYGRGGPWTVKYTDRWFAKYPTMLRKIESNRRLVA